MRRIRNLICKQSGLQSVPGLLSSNGLHWKVYQRCLLSTNLLLLSIFYKILILGNNSFIKRKQKIFKYLETMLNMILRKSKELGVLKRIKVEMILKTSLQIKRNCFTPYLRFKNKMMTREVTNNKMEMVKM